MTFSTMAFSVFRAVCQLTTTMLPWHRLARSAFGEIKGKPSKWLELLDSFPHQALLGGSSLVISSILALDCCTRHTADYCCINATNSAI